MNNWHGAQISQTYTVIRRALKQTGEVHAYMVFQLLPRIFKKKDQLVSMSAEIRPILRQEEHCICIVILCTYRNISCIAIIVATLTTICT